jgi:hypothetical protein
VQNEVTSARHLLETQDVEGAFDSAGVATDEKQLAVLIRRCHGLLQNSQPCLLGRLAAVALECVDIVDQEQCGRA